MKQFLKVILIISGGLCLFVTLAFLLVANLFKASPSDIREGNETLKQIFISLDLPPEKVESNGHYQYEGGGLDFYVTFSDEVINSHRLSLKKVLTSLKTDSKSMSYRQEIFLTIK